jgi:serine/threonine protein kinase
MLAPGTIVDGRYEIVDFLGEGGMGIVYSAIHTSMDRRIALKIMKTTLLSETEKVARFKNEARVLSELNHPNIIGVHAVGVSESGQPYIAMDIVTGDSLSEMIAKNGPFKQNEALEICIQICHGLDYAHRKQIIHRDIKPSNIVLTRSDGVTLPKLVDFGIAKILGTEQHLTRTGAAVGSIFYLSPGQLEGRGADPSSDIYALGCTLYEMLSGRPPFCANTAFETALMHRSEDATPVNQLTQVESIDENVQSIIDCMLQKEHHMRYQSAEHAAEDMVLALANSKPKHAPLRNARDRSSALRPSLRNTSFRSRTTRVVAISASVLMLGAVCLFAVTNNKTTQPSIVDKRLLALDALDLAQRLDANRVEDQASYSSFTNATQLALDCGDYNLIADAWRLQAAALSRVSSHAGVKDWLPEPLTQWQKSIDAANAGIASAKNPNTLNDLKKIRYESSEWIMRMRSNANQPMTVEDWKQFARYFEEGRSTLASEDVADALELIDASAKPFLKGDDDRFIALCEIRKNMARVAGWTPSQLRTDAEDKLPEIQQKRPSAVPRFKKLHNLP